ncbi:MAG: hypothetical protein HZC38_20285 [Chloroflexi bacterium]|nr:hypothetical protein [Chloroflexota bacterium]
MKKPNLESTKTLKDDMRPEYDFRGAVRGKYYKAMHKGYTVQIHKADGTTVVQNFKIEEGAVMLDPDVRLYFSNSESVNNALRSLIQLTKLVPSKGKEKKNGVGQRK